jgi:polysaccharide biosynthesis protein PslH
MTDRLSPIAKDSLRTLFVTKEKPYPPAGGVELRNWQNINIMRQYGSVGIFSITRWQNKVDIPAEIDRWQLYPLTNSPSLWETWQRRAWIVRPKAHPDMDRLYQNEAARQLERVIVEFKPDIVVIEEIWLYRYLNALKRHNCRIILDEHNIEADLYEQRYGNLKMRLPRLKAIEADFIRRVDRVWVCSDDDVRLLKMLYGEHFEPDAVPNGIDVTYYDSVRLRQCQPFQEIPSKPHNLIYMGTFSYEPNKVAAKLLLEEIYPRLRQRYPDCRLLMVGRTPTQQMQQAAKDDPQIIVTGSVPDVRPYLSASSVTIVPLLQGGGTRLKLLEAFASGCPAVSTSKGAEGLFAQDGEHLLIRDGTDALVEAIAELWSNPSLVQKLTAAAYELVKTQYSWQAVGKQVERSLQSWLFLEEGR